MFSLTRSRFVGFQVLLGFPAPQWARGPVFYPLYPKLLGRNGRQNQKHIPGYPFEHEQMRKLLEKFAFRQANNCCQKQAFKVVHNFALKDASVLWMETNPIARVLHPGRRQQNTMWMRPIRLSATQNPRTRSYPRATYISCHASGGKLLASRILPVGQKSRTCVSAGGLLTSGSTWNGTTFSFTKRFDRTSARFVNYISEPNKTTKFIFQPGNTSNVMLSKEHAQKLNAKPNSNKKDPARTKEPFASSSALWNSLVPLEFRICRSA